MIESTCVYLEADECYLMLLRNKKKNDLNAGKWIGVGGKKNKGETIEQCAIREVKEETDLDVVSLQYRGRIHFSYEHTEDEMIYVYTSTDFKGEIKECNEGTLAWIEKNKIPDLELWEGDRLFLPYLIEQSDEFALKLVYDENGKLLKAESIEV